MEKHSKLKNKKRKKQKQKQKNKTGIIITFSIVLVGGGLVVMDIDNSVGILLHGLIKNNPLKLTSN